VVERRAGRDEVVRRDAEAPFSVRRCGSRVLLAASAAAPVGGDELHLTIAVGARARADVGSVAATMVWPSPAPAWSSATTVCDVATGADLVWWPEPTVSVAGSFHRASTLVRLAPAASCTVVEEIALGRTGESPGVLVLDLRVECDGPLLHHTETFGRGASSVGTGAARYAISAALVGVAPGPSATEVGAATAAAWLPRTGDAAVALAVGPDRPTTWAALLRVVPPTAVRAFRRRTATTMVRPSDQTGNEVSHAHRT
jgi:urease accessory protein